MSSGETMGDEIRQARRDFLDTPNLRDVFIEIQGEMGVVEFAKVLGVSVALVSRIRTRQRNVTGKVLKALFCLYPEGSARRQATEAKLLAGIRSEAQ